MWNQSEIKTMNNGWDGSGILSDLKGETFFGWKVRIIWGFVGRFILKRTLETYR